MKTFASLLHVDFRRLWLAIACGNSGRWALTLGVGWQMQTLTHSPFWVGLAMFSLQGPTLVLGAVAGVLTDRYDRRRILDLAFLLAVAATAGLALLTLLHLVSPAGVLALTCVYGVAFAVQPTAWNSLLPALVPRASLLNAVSLQGMARQGAEFVGPAVASPLLVAFGPGAVYCLCCLFYVGAAVQSRRIGPAVQALEAAQSRWLANFSEGWRYLRAQSMTATVILLIGFHCSLTMAFMGVLPTFVTASLGGGDSTYGAMMTALGLGAIGGTLWLAGVSDQRRRGVLLLGTSLLSGLTLAVLGTTHGRLAALVAAVAVGASQGAFMALGLAYIQDWVDDAFRGRVVSLYAVITVGTMALFNWGFGALATIIPAAAVLELQGVGFVVAVGAFAVASAGMRQVFVGREAVMVPLGD